MSTHALAYSRFADVRATDLDPCGRQHTPATSRTGTVPFGVAVDTGRFANPFDTPGLTTPVERMGALVRYAVRLAGRRDDLAAVREQLLCRDLWCTCAPNDPACHRNVLLDVANPTERPFNAGGRAMAITVRRPWASLLLTPAELGGKTVENRTFATDYRGPMMIYGGTKVDEAGMDMASEHGLDAAWHEQRRGWLGAAVLVGVHRATSHCCQPWGQPPLYGPNRPTRYHWVFAHPWRLAAATFARGKKAEGERGGFEGIRPMSWQVLMPTARATTGGGTGASGDRASTK
jgi:hypothetical protein